MTTMTHEARVARIVETLRSAPVGEWTAIRVALVGTLFVHRVPAEAADKFGWNEVWVRFGSKVLWESTGEDRGTAEAIAKRLCRKLRAPSKAIQAAIDAIQAAYTQRNPGGQMGVNDLRGPELAAWLGLDELTTYRALDHMAEMGLVRDGGETGWQDAA